MGCGGLALEEGFPELLCEVPHRLYRSDEIAEAVFFATVDESDIGGRIDRQPLENWRQILRNTAALAFDDCAVRPVDQRQIIPDFIGNRALRIVAVKVVDIFGNNTMTLVPINVG